MNKLCCILLVLVLVLEIIFLFRQETCHCDSSEILQALHSVARVESCKDKKFTTGQEENCKDFFKDLKNYDHIEANDAYYYVGDDGTEEGVSSSYSTSGYDVEHNLKGLIATNEDMCEHPNCVLPRNETRKPEKDCKGTDCDTQCRDNRRECKKNDDCCSGYCSNDICQFPA